MVLANPVFDIAGKELANWLTVFPIEVDRVTPFRAALPVEIIIGVLRQVVAVGAKVVIDDVEYHSHFQTVGVIDEAAEVVRTAVMRVRSIQIDSVIAPAEIARKAG